MGLKDRALAAYDAQVAYNEKEAKAELAKRAIQTTDYLKHQLGCDSVRDEKTGTAKCDGLTFTVIVDVTLCLHVMVPCDICAAPVFVPIRSLVDLGIILKAELGGHRCSSVKDCEVRKRQKGQPR